MSLNLDRSGWLRLSLGTVATASKEKVSPSDGTVDRYVAGEHMDSDDLKIHRWGDPNETALGPAFHRRFRPGQVLYGSRRTYLRKVAVADFDGVCANTTFVVQTKDPARLLPEFLPFVMSAEPFHAFAIAESKGSVNPYVNWSDIERYEFDLPPLDEQKRIADLLWTAERSAVAQTAYRTELALVRKTWIDEGIERFLSADQVAFADLWQSSPDGGYSAAPVDQETGKYVLSLSALGSEGYRPGNLKHVPDTEQTRSASLSRGDLLISRANTADLVGRVGIFCEARDDVSFPDTMMRLRLKPEVSNEFAAAVLGSIHGRTHMRRSAAGSATSMVKINRASLGRLRFPIVSRSTQRAFLEDLKVQDHALARLDSETGALERLRTALVEEVFGGN